MLVNPRAQEKNSPSIWEIRFRHHVRASCFCTCPHEVLFSPQRCQFRFRSAKHSSVVMTSPSLYLRQPSLRPPPLLPSKPQRTDIIIQISVSTRIVNGLPILIIEDIQYCASAGALIRLRAIRQRAGVPLGGLKQAREGCFPVELP